MTSSKIIEVMRDGMFGSAEWSNFWAEDEAYKLCEAALAALQASGMAVVAGWQPIESAPTNQRVLIQANNETTDECAMGWFDLIAQKWFYAPQGGLVLWTPTHWQPILASPNIKAQGRVGATSSDHPSQSLQGRCAEPRTRDTSAPRRGTPERPRYP